MNIMNIIITKVWDLDSISSPVHSIDRHELGIEDILVSRVEGEVLTRCRNCVLVWDINTGKVYVSCLNDQALNALFNSESYLKLRMLRMLYNADQEKNRGVHAGSSSDTCTADL